MGLLTKLKSLLGFEDDGSEVRRGESGVTIERDPEAETRPDAETESAVKGVDAGAEESFESDETADSESPTTTTPEGIEKVEAASETDVTETEAEPEVELETEPEVEPETPSEVEESDETEGEEVETDEAETETSPEADETEGDEAEGETDEAEADETEVEEVEADETTEEAAEAGEPLEDVKGIGPAYAERLREAGIDDVADLATADADRLAAETDVSAKRISSWIERARAR